MAELDEKEIFWVQSQWVVVHESVVTTDDAGAWVLADESVIVRVQGDRNKAILVYTDKDLANRFIEKLGKPGFVAVPFKSRDHFAAFLQRAISHGDTHVGFDPEGNCRVISIERVLSAIAKGESPVTTEQGGLKMTIPTQPITVPLFDDGQGGLRVSGSRVQLERIVHAFQDGATPEGIVQRYDTLNLAHVYLIIAWYLFHKAEVEEYLSRREAEAVDIRRQIEAKQPDRTDLRARLMARRTQKDAAHAPAAQ